MVRPAHLHSEYLGLMPYLEALSYQERLRDELHRKFCDGEPITHRLLGLEHPSVITLGRRAVPSEEILDAGGSEVVRIERGGLATLHNPGQLVIYPVFHLKELRLGVRDWVSVLLKTTAGVLSELGVEARERLEPAGVFTERGKIAFVGVQIRQGISIHGLSINLTNNLKEFGKIQSCGMAAADLDSLEESGPSGCKSLKEVFEMWSVEFLKNLGAVKAPLNAGLMGQRNGIVSTGGGVAGSHDRN